MTENYPLTLQKIHRAVERNISEQEIREAGVQAEVIEQDNLVLDEWFTRQGYSSKDNRLLAKQLEGRYAVRRFRQPNNEIFFERVLN